MDELTRVLEALGKLTDSEFERLKVTAKPLVLIDRGRTKQEFINIVSHWGKPHLREKLHHLCRELGVDTDDGLQAKISSGMLTEAREANRIARSAKTIAWIAVVFSLLSAMATVGIFIISIPK